MEMPHLRYFLIWGVWGGNRTAQLRHFENRWEPNKAIKIKHLATGAKASRANVK